MNAKLVVLFCALVAAVSASHHSNDGHSQSGYSYGHGRYQRSTGSGHSSHSQPGYSYGHGRYQRSTGSGHSSHSQPSYGYGHGRYQRSTGSGHSSHSQPSYAFGHPRNVRSLHQAPSYGQHGYSAVSQPVHNSYPASHGHY